MRLPPLPSLAWLVAALALPQGAAALVVGQLDDFEDGTTQGWVVSLLGNPHPAPPVNVPTGGPAGDGDHWLQLTSVGGFGAGSRLVVVNQDQWAGSYAGAGVQRLRMDVNNLGDTQLALRVYLEDAQGGPPTNAAVSTLPVVLPPGSGWTSIELPIAASDLTAVAGSVDAVLANATALRILHGASPTFPPDPIVAVLGVDNVRAVPEPDARWLLACSAAALGALRRRRA